MAKKNIKFGDFLGKLIEKNNLNYRKTSIAIKVDPTTIGNYVNNGRVPEAHILQKLADLFGVTAKELLAGKKATEKDKSYDKTPLKHLPGIEEHSIPEKHRDLVTKLIEILESANRYNAKAITINVNAFHKSKDLPLDENGNEVYDCSDGCIKKLQMGKGNLF